MLVTFTSDFGQDDYYKAAVKGAILSLTPDAKIIDISNNVAPYDIIKASFLVRNVFMNFPKNTVHIVSVDDYYSLEADFLIVKCQGHYFIAPDNGVLSMSLQNLAYKAWKLILPSGLKNVLNYVYSVPLHYLSAGLPLEEIAVSIEEIVIKTKIQPVVSGNFIRGMVIHVDNYENVITNISKELFTQIIDGKDFKLFYRRDFPIVNLSERYNDVEVGMPLCWFNSTDLLELSVNKGKASSLLGLAENDIIQIAF